jgi:hypothetical protein
MAGIFQPIATALTKVIGSKATEAIGSGISAGLSAGIGDKIQRSIAPQASSFGHSSVGNALSANSGQANLQSMVDYKTEAQKQLITHQTDEYIRQQQILNPKMANDAQNTVLENIGATLKPEAEFIWDKFKQGRDYLIDKGTDWLWDVNDKHYNYTGGTRGFKRTYP